MFYPELFDVSLCEDDRDLVEVFKIMTHEGLIDDCFPGDKMMRRVFSFVTRMGDTEHNHVYLCRYCGDLVGIAWLNRWEGFCSRINFCSFKAGKKIVVQGIQESAMRILQAKDEQGSFVYDTLLGYIKSSNKLSQKVARKSGFKHVGTIPLYYRFPDQNNSIEIYQLTREIS